MVATQCFMMDEDFVKSCPIKMVRKANFARSDSCNQNMETNYKPRNWKKESENPSRNKKEIFAVFILNNPDNEKAWG